MKTNAVMKPGRAPSLMDERMPAWMRTRYSNARAQRL